MGVLHTNTVAATTTYVVDTGPLMLMSIYCAIGGGDEGTSESFNGSATGDAVAANLQFKGQIGGAGAENVQMTLDGVLLPKGCVVKLTLGGSGPAIATIEIE